jgi:16S rRNA (adenine1518-N6/adenine1519-N6)-dimethyltransferase
MACLFPPSWSFVVTTTLLGPAEIRELAGTLGVRPTKTLGQNFVHDGGSIRKIVRASGVNPGQRVLEVGPGLGSLTLGLLEAGASVVAVEIDPTLAAALPFTIAKHATEASFDVVLKDALKVKASDLPGEQPTALVANLPYNVSVPILLHLLQELPTLNSVLVMVQAEVSDRIAAKPGNKVYGIPSAKIAWYADASRTLSISRNVFWPVPNVDSALVSMVKRPAPSTMASRSQVFSVIDAAFAARRKTLRGTLASLFGGADKAEQALREAGIDPGARGETLDISQFAKIAEQLPAAIS